MMPSGSFERLYKDEINQNALRQILVLFFSRIRKNEDHNLSATLSLQLVRNSQIIKSVPRNFVQLLGCLSKLRHPCITTIMGSMI